MSPSALTGDATFRRREGAPPFVYGHRGVRGEAPENTMAAFEIAADAGAAGFELDVRVCGSGELVVCHDPTLARSTGGRDVRAVAGLPWSELSRVDVGGGQPIPLLGEVLRWARGRGLRVNVEMKRDVPNRSKVVEETVRVIGAGPAPADVIVSSFDPWMLARFGWLFPGVLRGLIFGADQRLQSSGWVSAVLRADAVHPENTLVVANRSRRWQKRRTLINVWTVNDADEARRLAALGVDGIVTDVPRVILAAVS